MNNDTTLTTLQRQVLAFREARAWRQFHTPKNLAMALAIEAGELQELFLWKDDGEIQAALHDPHFHSRLQDEMADVLIFLLYLAEAAQVDLAEAVPAKLAKNEAKYPVAKCRGRHIKYSELD